MRLRTVAFAFAMAGIVALWANGSTRQAAPTGTRYERLQAECRAAFTSPDDARDCVARGLAADFVEAQAARRATMYDAAARAN